MNKKSLLWGILTMALGAFFLMDVIIPDPVPFLEEIIAGLGALLGGAQTVREVLKKARDKKREQVKPLPPEKLPPSYIPPEARK